MFLSYRNQSVDLLCKSADWFLYDENIGHLRVKSGSLTHFKPMSIFIPPENIKKIPGFLMFSGVARNGILAKNGSRIFYG